MKAAALSGARRDARARFLATERRFIAVPVLDEGHEKTAAERVTERDDDFTDHFAADPEPDAPT
jgi:hypothetical protein